jgi:lactoylglutathione lyase
MHIHHIAIWVRDLQSVRAFYETYFAARAGELYTNPRTGFRSYFLSFETGAQIELMSRADVAERPIPPPAEGLGYAHLSITLGSPEAVEALVERMRREGVQIIGQPRRTGDGYYEAVVLDPEGSRVEIAA